MADQEMTENDEHLPHPVVVEEGQKANSAEKKKKKKKKKSEKKSPAHAKRGKDEAGLSTSGDEEANTSRDSTSNDEVSTSDDDTDDKKSKIPDLPPGIRTSGHQVIRAVILMDKVG